MPSMIADTCATAGDQASEKEIREGEAQATVQVQIFTVACAALWFCMFWPTSNFEIFRLSGSIAQGKLSEK